MYQFVRDYRGTINGLKTVAFVEAHSIRVLLEHKQTELVKSSALCLAASNSKQFRPPALVLETLEKMP